MIDRPLHIIRTTDATGKGYVVFSSRDAADAARRYARLVGEGMPVVLESPPAPESPAVALACNDAPQLAALGRLYAAQAA